MVPAPAPFQGQGLFVGQSDEGKPRSKGEPGILWASQSESPMRSDLTAIVISSVFLGVGFVIAKFFPEAALLAAVFLVGLAILNVALVLVA